MITENAQMVEQSVMVQELAPAAAPTTATGTPVSLKGYERATIYISGANATTVTGSAITLNQYDDVANADSKKKALAFTTYYANLDIAANGDAGLTATTASSNTFTTSAVNSKKWMYVIEVTPDMMDISNGFNSISVTATGSSAATTFGCHILLWPAKYGSSVPADVSPDVN